MIISLNRRFVHSELIPLLSIAGASIAQIST